MEAYTDVFGFGGEPSFSLVNSVIRLCSCEELPKEARTVANSTITTYYRTFTGLLRVGKRGATGSKF